jgi:hypothetical protein
MDLYALEALLLKAQVKLDTGDRAQAIIAIVGAKLMVQAEMARIQRVKSGDTVRGDEKRRTE